MFRSIVCCVLLAACLGVRSQAQGLERLTLEDAKAIALQNHPNVQAARFQALAEDHTVTQARAALRPNVVASATGAGALDTSRLAAGALNNPIILNRFAMGAAVTQLISDFGRTSSLAQSAQLRADALDEGVRASELDVLLAVEQNYFNCLRAQAVLRVAEETVQARRLVADQVEALESSGLRSGLDVSFANADLSESRLLLANAENEIRAAFADLSNAMGFPEPREFDLQDVFEVPPLAEDSTALAESAMRARPEIMQLRLEVESAGRFADAERYLTRPAVSAIAAGGLLPAHDPVNLRGRYAAAGVNVTVPVLNGRLFSARRSEAEMRVRAQEQTLRALENQVKRDVSVAWLGAYNAFQRLDLTAQMLAYSDQGLDLAQARYDLGLSSIVELSQAQLAKTGAEIASTNAQYEYRMRYSMLLYHAGVLR